MNALLLLVATAAVGVDVGWQPLADGGVEYTIQIEPQLLETLAKDHDLSSDLPVGLDIRRIRITVGTGQLPRIMPAAPAARPSVDRSSDARRSQPAGPPTADPVPMMSGSNQNMANGPDASPPQAAPPLAAQPTPASPALAATPPPSVPPLSAAPAVAAPPLANTADSASGPALGPAIALPAESPDAFAVRQRGLVSGALDDPNAPGRSRLPETAQPKLPADGLLARNKLPRTLEPDPTSEQLADYNATPHEAQRQNERGVGPDNGQGYQAAVERGPVDGPVGQHHAASQYTASNAPAHNRYDSAVPAPRSTHEEALEKPWTPLMGTVTMLLLSISANVYLAWVAWESRMRYRELLAEHGSSPLAA